MSTLIRYAPEGLTREQYDKVNEILSSQGNGEFPPEIELHVLFGDEGNLRVSEIWSNADAWREMYDGPLGAALKEAGVQMAQEPELYEVHEIAGSRVAAATA